MLIAKVKDSEDTHRMQQNFQIGNWILVYVKPCLQRKKLQIHWSGPFQVTLSYGACIWVGSPLRIVGV